jgi:hypothetical protein
MDEWLWRVGLNYAHPPQNVSKLSAFATFHYQSALARPFRLSSRLTWHRPVPMTDPE